MFALACWAINVEGEGGPYGYHVMITEYLALEGEELMRQK
jgi:hypothetical protein